MITAHRLQKWFETGRYETILDGLAANGLLLPLPLRIRLTQIPAGVVALGLRRLLELTYDPASPTADGMRRWLLTAQSPDGSFAGDPLATAAVAAAMIRLDRHCSPSLPSLRCDRDDSPVVRAYQRALDALAAMQDQDGLFHAPEDRTPADRTLAAAFVAYLLADEPVFRQVVRFADLMDTLAENHEALDAEAQAILDIAQMQSGNDPHAVADRSGLIRAA